MPSEGVLYIAVGDDFVREVVDSATQLRRTNPDVNIALVTERPTIEDGDLPEELFDDLVPADTVNRDLRDKAFNLHLSPYERTVYLDGDTYVTGDISDLFSLLDEFDVALAHAPYREVLSKPDIPSSFPEFNGGVICFCDTDEVRQFLNRWVSKYKAQIERGSPDGEVVFEDCDSLEEIPNGRKHDQPPLREALYESDLRIATLPPEYNFRGAGGYAQSKITVVHARHPRLNEFATALNAHLVPRVYANWKYKIFFSNGADLRDGYPYPRLHRVIDKLRESGVLSALDRVGLLGPLRRAYNRLLGWD